MSPFLEIRKSQALYKSAIDKMWEYNVRCFSIAKCNQVQSAQLKHSICFCKSAAIEYMLHSIMNILQNTESFQTKFYSKM